MTHRLISATSRAIQEKNYQTLERLCHMVQYRQISQDDVSIIAQYTGMIVQYLRDDVNMVVQ